MTILTKHIEAFRQIFASPHKPYALSDLRSQLSWYPAAQRSRLADLSSLLSLVKEGRDVNGQIFLGTQRALQLASLFPRDGEGNDDFLARYQKLIAGEAGDDLRSCNPQNCRVIGKGKGAKILEVPHRRSVMKYFHNPTNHVGVALDGFFLELVFQGIPNVQGAVEVSDFGLNDEGKPYLLMDWMEGGNLMRLAPLVETFTPQAVLGAVSMIVGALAVTHERGIVHRDIKPENILCDAQGGFKLADFGLANTPDELENLPRNPFQNAHFCGTRGFIPPEAYREGHQELDEITFDSHIINPDYQAGFAGDVYAMGAALLVALLVRPRTWRLLGRKKWAVRELNQSIRQFRSDSDQPPFNKISDPIRPVLRKALSAEPADRYQNGVEMLEALWKAGAPESPWTTLSAAV